METVTYTELSDLTLLALCCWREARGETYAGMRGVCHVIKNRTLKPGKWGHDWKTVILHPFAFSSFNSSDPNSYHWPADDSPSWTQCMSAASAIYTGQDEDLTDGATYYFDTSISWPKAWGKEEDFVNTLNLGRLRFFKPVEII